MTKQTAQERVPQPNGGEVFGVDAPRVSPASTAASVSAFIERVGDARATTDDGAIALFREGRSLMREIDRYVESAKGRAQHSAESLDEAGRLAGAVSEHLATYFHEAARFEYFGIMKSAQRGIDRFTELAMGRLLSRVGEEALRTGSHEVEDAVEDIADDVVRLFLDDAPQRLASQPEANREWLLTEMKEMWEAAGRFFVNEIKLLVLEHKDITQRGMLIDGEAALERARRYAQEEQRDLVHDDELQAKILPAMRALAHRLDDGALFLRLDGPEKRLQAILTSP